MATAYNLRNQIARRRSERPAPASTADEIREDHRRGLWSKAEAAERLRAIGVAPRLDAPGAP